MSSSKTSLLPGKLYEFRLKDNARSLKIWKTLESDDTTTIGNALHGDVILFCKSFSVRDWGYEHHWWYEIITADGYIGYVNTWNEQYDLISPVFSLSAEIQG